MIVSRESVGAGEPEKFAAVWEAIDHDAVRAAIGEGNPYIFDADEAFDAVHVACQRWLVEDILQIDITGVETERIEENFKFVVDLEGTYTGEGTKIVQYDDRSYRAERMHRFAKRRVIIDWKTTKVALDARWMDRYVDSAQWRDYLACTGADLFVFRGVRRVSKVLETHDTREFILDRSLQPDLVPLHKVNLQGIEAQRDALIDLNIHPWPQNRANCGDYGGCPYKSDCDAGLKYIPAGNLEKGRALSFSRMTEFQQCAEKHRRSVLARIAQDEESTGPDAEFGSAFHRGIAEVYKQIFEVR